MSASTDFLELARRPQALAELGPILYEKLHGTSAWVTLDAQLQSAMSREAARAAVIEAGKRERIAEVIEELALAGVRPVLFKGTALAYTLYEKPEHRPRQDTDLLIRIEDRERVTGCLANLGYRKVNANSGDLISYQTSYVQQDTSGIVHTFDFHWRVSNPQFFSRILTYDEMRAASRPAPGLCLHALAANDVHALIMACIHRVAHHHDIENLLWLYDIHLLCSNKDNAWFENFARCAGQKGVASLCVRGLELAMKFYSTALPAFLLPALETQGREEWSARYLSSDRLWYKDLWFDLIHLDSNNERLRFLLEHAFPAGEFMLEKYGAKDRRWLPVLYTHRAVSGAHKLLRRRLSFALTESEE